MFEIIDDQESEYSGLIFKNMMIAGVMLIVMAQISISVMPEKTEYIDKLPSYKDIKKKFISSYIGRTLAACNGIAKAYPWLMQDPIMQGNDIPFKISKLIFDLVDNPTPNIRRIKPSVREWQLYAKGEYGAALGQMLSCPSTNLKILNLDGSKLKDYDLSDAFEAIGIKKEALDRYSITCFNISSDIKSNYLLNGSGMPINVLHYKEPRTIYSKIQEEIMSSNILRTDFFGSDNNTEKHLNFNELISLEQIENYLTKYELIAYNFALKSGDKNILKKYTELVKQRIKSNLLLLNYESRVH